jgi:hypothetical protein
MTNSEGSASDSTDGEAHLVAFVQIPETAGDVAVSMMTDASGEGAVRNVGNFLRDDGAGAATSIARALRRTPRPRAVVGQIPLRVLRENLPQGTTYITMLRDPVERAAAHLRRRGTSEQSLEEMLVQPQSSNLQTRFFCNDPDPLGELPSDALDQAKASLEQLAVVGLEERFDESLALFQVALGTNAAGADPRNGRRRAGRDLEPAQRTLIEQANSLDVELYEHARTLFDKALLAAGPQVEQLTAALRATREAAASQEEAATGAAAEWLTEQLAPGTTRPVAELLEAAAGAGLSEDAVRRAAQQIGVKRRGDGADGRKVWTVPARAAEKQPRRRKSRQKRTSGAPESGGNGV